MQRNQEQVNRLGTAKVTKLMLEFAIPSIIGLVVNGTYNIIDSIFLGHGVGDIGQATATNAMPIMIVGMAISILIGQGGNALTALRLGAGKREEAERVMGNTFTLLIAAAVLCTALVIIFIEPLLAISGATEHTWAPTRTFLWIIAAGTIFQFFGMGFNNFMRTAGDPNRALYTMLVGTFTCIVLNALFVMGFGWGVAGSAWATVIGQAVSAVFVFWYFVFSKKSPFSLKRKYLKLEWRFVKSIIALGSAPFVLQISAALLTFLLNNQLKLLGATHVIGSDGALAAIGVVGRVAMFMFFPLLGAAIAAQPLFGYNYGAGNMARVKKTFNISMIWVTAIGLFFWAIVHLIPEQICSLFNITGDLLHFTTTALKIQVFMMPLVGLQIVATQYFQSTGQPLKSMFLSMTRQILFLIPPLYLFPMIIMQVMPGTTPLDGIYWSYPVADALSVVTCGILVAIEFRKLNRKIREQSQEQQAG